MNWMIDGVYGDLYRTTMGYRQLGAHHNSPKAPLHADASRKLGGRGAAIGKLLTTGRAALEAAGFSAATNERIVS